MILLLFVCCFFLFVFFFLFFFFFFLFFFCFFFCCFFFFVFFFVVFFLVAMETRILHGFQIFEQFFSQYQIRISLIGLGGDVVYTNC